MKIYALIEDSKPKGSPFIAEHGLCLYFEHQEQRILFDTGASDAFIYNATLLGIDLVKVDICILTHAHDDHTGGLSHFLGINPNARVYLKNAARGDFYIRHNAKMEYAGMDRTVIDRFAERLHFIDGDVELVDGLYAASIKKHRRLPLFASLMFEKRSGVMVHDDLSQELFVAVRESDGVTVLTGCAHSGLLNILMTAEEKYGDIKAAVGGFHLGGVLQMGRQSLHEPGREVQAIVKYLNENRIKKVYTGHCTGKKAFEKLELLARVTKIQAGDIIDV